MKLLITGATGLVGKELVKEALDQGHRINYLSTQKKLNISSDKVKGFYWSPKTQEIDLTCFDGIDVIIHLAGASISQRWTKSNKEEIYNSRIDSTLLLIDSLKELPEHTVKHVICASAIGIYPSSLNKVYTEMFKPTGNSFLEHVVIDWESTSNKFNDIGISTAILRIGLVLTKKGGLLQPLKLPTSFGLGAAFGSGKQVQSWIHVTDLVGIFLMAINEKWEGIYNAVGPNPVNQTVFMKTFAKALNRPFFLPALPKFIISFFMGEMSTLIFNSQLVSADKVLSKGYRFKYPNLLQAIQSLTRS